MTEMEKLFVMWAVGFILTVTITGSVILDAKMDYRQKQDELNSRYDGPMYPYIPIRGSVE
jgi:hypothetical protein